MTVPPVPVDAYAADLAQMVADALIIVLPYAAAMTAFVIGLQILKRWLGHRKATSLGSSPSYDSYDRAYEPRGFKDFSRDVDYRYSDRFGKPGQ